MIKFVIFIPRSISILVLKKSNFILFLKSQNFHLLLNLFNEIKISAETNTLTALDSNYYVLEKLFFFFKSVSQINLKSIKFKGKGYKLVKKKNSLNFMFNFAHLSYLLTPLSLTKKTQKNKILILNSNLKYLNNLSKDILKIRASNYYTLNGLRFKRQFIKRRKGKTLTN